MRIPGIVPRRKPVNTRKSVMERLAWISPSASIEKNVTVIRDGTGKKRGFNNPTRPHSSQRRSNPRRETSGRRMR
jgi:hypothetical protein